MKELRKYAWRSVAFVVCVAAGCSTDTTTPVLPSAPTPLTVSEWRELPVSEKYDETTFTRLKMQDAKLRDEREWSRFMMETVIPERKRDLPDDLPG